MTSQYAISDKLERNTVGSAQQGMTLVTEEVKAASRRQEKGACLERAEYFSQRKARAYPSDELVESVWRSFGVMRV